MAFYVNRFHIESATLILKGIFSKRISSDVTSKITRINKMEMGVYANDYNIIIYLLTSFLFHAIYGSTP